MTTLRNFHPLGMLTAVLLVSVFGAGPAHAGSTTCNGTLLGTFANIVAVPGGTGCFVADSIVNGNIAVQPGASLAVETTIVRGNISATDPQIVRLVRVEVGGNVSIVGATGFPNVPSVASVSVCGAHITGNVRIVDSSNVLFGGIFCGPLFSTNTVSGNVSIEDNDADNLFEVSNNTIGKNMSIAGNTGPVAKDISNNAVTGNFSCSDNDDPFNASGNTAKKLNGQCKP